MRASPAAPKRTWPSTLRRKLRGRRETPACKSTADSASLAATVAGHGGAAAQIRALREAEQQVAEPAHEVAEIIAELDALGVQVKDIEVGLVDFPADRGGETVLLCWKVGEEAVGYWHGLEEGYAGRKPLPF